MPLLDLLPWQYQYRGVWRGLPADPFLGCSHDISPSIICAKSKYEMVSYIFWLYLIIRIGGKRFRALSSREVLVLAHLGIDSTLYNSKKVVSFIRFMVLKMTNLSSRFQRKNLFWKTWNGSWDIGQNIAKYAGLVWQPWFWHILFNILGPNTCFSKQIFELKPWAQAIFK